MFLIYAGSDENTVPAQVFAEHHDNYEKLAERVFHFIGNSYEVGNNDAQLAVRNAAENGLF